MPLFCSKKISALVRGITSRNVGDFYCFIIFFIDLNRFHSFRTKNKVEVHSK